MVYRTIERRKPLFIVSGKGKRKRGQDFEVGREVEFLLDLIKMCQNWVMGRVNPLSRVGFWIPDPVSVM